MKKMLFYLAVLLSTISLESAFADNVAVVVVNKANNNVVNKAFLAKIYLGKVSHWPDGTPVLAIDLTEGNPIHDKFYTEVLGKTPAVVRTIWEQNIFAGRRLPPRIVGRDAEIIRLVKENKNAIGYINASSFDNSVKAIRQ